MKELTRNIIDQFILLDLAISEGDAERTDWAMEKLDDAIAELAAETLSLPL